MRHIRKLGSLVLSAAAGVGVGILTGKLFVPLIQMGYFSTDQVLPLPIIRDTGDDLRLANHPRLLLADEPTGAVDVKTGSELVLRQNLRQQLDAVGGFEEMQEEFAVPDQAGRVQIPREVLLRLALKGNRVRIEVEDGKNLLIPPEN